MSAKDDAASQNVTPLIEYQLEDAAGEVTETLTLITTLLDPDAAPARELAEPPDSWVWRPVSYETGSGNRRSAA
jgi:hypothetical protein